VALLEKLSALSRRLAEATELEDVLRAAAEGVATELGLEHSMWFVLADGADRLSLVESYGYDASGVGSEVPMGQGTIGTVAARGIPVRLPSMRTARAYGRAARDPGVDVEAREIPMPGLADVQSQLAVPMIALGKTLGVVCVESGVPGALSKETEHALSLVAAQVASAIAHLGLESDAASESADESGAPEAGSDDDAPEPDASHPAVHVRHYEEDGSVFLDGEYLIKSLPGRLLWRLLCQWRDEGRRDFTNKELRLDPSLKLPPVKDNLDTRLLLLRRRLEERSTVIALRKSGRGRMRLEVSAPLELDYVPGG
jgi:hypothetical protein